MKLYFSPGACSFVPHALLEIAGESFEASMVKLHKGEHFSAEYNHRDPTTLPASWALVQRIAQLLPVARAIERERLQLNLFQPAPVHP